MWECIEVAVSKWVMIYLCIFFRERLLGLFWLPIKKKNCWFQDFLWISLYVEVALWSVTCEKCHLNEISVVLWWESSKGMKTSLTANVSTAPNFLIFSYPPATPHSPLSKHQLTEVSERITVMLFLVHFHYVFEPWRVLRDCSKFDYSLFISELHIASDTGSFCLSVLQVCARKSSFPLTHIFRLFQSFFINIFMGKFRFYSVLWRQKWGLLTESTWILQTDFFSISCLFWKYHDCFPSHLTSQHSRVLYYFQLRGGVGEGCRQADFFSYLLVRV